jgi:hypothetical protein
LAAIMKICAHMVGLQERMRGPKYDVFGPWPVAPAHIVNAYQGHSVLYIGLKFAEFLPLESARAPAPPAADSAMGAMA